MNEKMRSSVMGLLLGQFSSPLPMAQKEPVAYLYNGVRLPKLPEWDREKYPYAYIWQASSGTYSLVFVNAPLYYQGELSGKDLICSNGIVSSYALEGITKNGEWGNRIVESTLSLEVNVTLIWCNTDVYDKAGEVYLAASDPAPIYE